MRALLSRPFNAVAYYFIWLGCVLGREEWLPLVAPLVIAYILLLLARRCLTPAQWLLPAGLGIAVDVSLSLAGVLNFDSSLVLPLWMVILWLAFATTLSSSLAFLNRYRIIAGIAGALAFPLNYWAGERFGAVELGEPTWLSLAALGLIWAGGLPLAYKLVSHFRPRSPASA